MATYKKRGYKPKAIKEQIDVEPEVDAENLDSTTADVFNTLDETANKTEEWVAANQKYIFGAVGALALLALMYIGYDRFIDEPKQTASTNEIFQAQQIFKEAQEASLTEKDSLYNLALNGSGDKLGFLAVIDKYGNTDSGNIAKYYAGFAYLRTKKYKEAIEYLDAFSTKDYILKALAYGGIGDAFAQLDNNKEALNYYEKAVGVEENTFTTPKFLLKIAKTGLLMNNKNVSVKALEKLEDKYSKSSEFLEVEALLGKATAL